MGLTPYGWKNKVGTGSRTSCRCGDWSKHWLNYSGNPWPHQCSALDCWNPATLGGHVHNPEVQGEKIVPLCASCNGRTDSFALKQVSTVSANKSETCERGIIGGLLGRGI